MISNLTSDGPTPPLSPQGPTIPEKSSGEILAILKGLPSHLFFEKVKDLYIGRWTQEPGWQVTVYGSPSKHGEAEWCCCFMEVGSQTLVMATTAQDISALRPGAEVTVFGRISEVWQNLPIRLEDATILGDNVSVH